MAKSILLDTKFFGLGKRHVLDYQLVFKQSVEECYQAFFSGAPP